MTDKDDFDPIFSHKGPEFDVWAHLHSGLDQARWELDVLPERARNALAQFGEQLRAQRTGLTTAPEDRFADLAPESLGVPWLKFAADIAFAEEAIDRGVKALERYGELQPILTRYRLSDRAATYLQEAARAFLFSFDAACIAFCSSALEQTLKDLLIDAQVKTQRDLDRDRSGALRLLDLACGARLLGRESEDAARALITKRNSVMHRSFDSMKKDALQAIEKLGIVLQELGRIRATDA